MIKIGLIIFNFILIVTVLYSAAGRWKAADASKEDDSFSVVKKEKKTAPAESPVRKTTARSMNSKNPEQQLALLTENNLFDSARCQNARVFGMANNSKKNIEMSLVGTFTIASYSGAIILQKDKNLNTMLNQQPMMGPPSPPGLNNTAGGSNRRFGVQPTNGTEEETVVYKQYVRCGETMANGYKLVSVSRDGAVLSKGRETLELSILNPSDALANAAKNTASSKNGGKGNFTPEQLQQMEQMEINRRMQFDRMREARQERDFQRQNGGNSMGGAPGGGNNSSSRASSGNSGRRAR